MVFQLKKSKVKISNITAFLWDQGQVQESGINSSKSKKSDDCLKLFDCWMITLFWILVIDWPQVAFCTLFNAHRSTRTEVSCTDHVCTDKQLFIVSSPYGLWRKTASHHYTVSLLIYTASVFFSRTHLQAYEAPYIHCTEGGVYDLTQLATVETWPWPYSLVTARWNNQIV